MARRPNLDAPRSIRRACDAGNLQGWFEQECEGISNPKAREIVLTVGRDVGSFVRFPQEAILLWRGCLRASNRATHRYPGILKEGAKERLVKALDTRANGPAISAFLFAGGSRPPRDGTHNAWSIHHLYSGKFAYPGSAQTLHATKSGLHFTQSAGLVAIHPIADAISDEYAAFAWLLRAEAFSRFGYDPDRVLSVGEHDELGFQAGRSCETLHEEPGCG